MQNSEVMTFYHATTQSRGQQIIKTGRISRDAPPAVTWMLATTPGWVYLSDHIDHAIHWGNKVSILTKETEIFYIFKISLPLSQCHPDVDNLIYEEWMSPDEAAEVNLTSCLAKCHSCRTANDLIVSEHIVAYCTLPVNHPRNKVHPLWDVVRNLICHVSPHEHILFEKHRRMINWASL